MSKTAKTVASSHQFLGGSWTFFKLAAAPIGIFAALHSSSLCNSLLCPGCREIRWCFGNLRIPMVENLCWFHSSRYFCQPPWPEILWRWRRLRLSMLRCGLLHLLVPWEQNTHRVPGKVEDLYGELAIYVDIMTLKRWYCGGFLEVFYVI